MSYLEKKKINKKTHFYFVKKVSYMGKSLIIKKYLGSGSLEISKEKYILDHLDELSNEEYLFRCQFLDKIKNKLSYSQLLPGQTELKTIKIKNYSEGKRCEKLIDAEFAAEFIFNSNNIEGSKIPPNKVREIIEKGNTQYENKNEVKEVKNSIIAYEYLKKRFKFNISSIKRLYHLLTKDLVMENKLLYPKGFKKIDNVVGNSATTPFKKIELELHNLLKWYHENKKKMHPLLLAFEFHKKYEFIHPFLDGNGRTGRLIMNKILISKGYSPIIVYKENKASYFNALEKSREGKLKNYYQFLLKQANKTYDSLLEFIKKY
ncbi:MAG: filamentation induced by cAMP protein Fic [archaeon GW2011_AR19]|nr:MAG: filamentation induced by cAMP protein Fic [archaeon GW2011_AR19]